MKRQLKFRVWDFFKKRWVKSWVDHCSQSIAFLPEESNDGKHNVEFFDTFDGSEFVLQQYTGLLDKNGNPIYEGDIVLLKIPSNDQSTLCNATIVWDYYQYAFEIHSSENTVLLVEDWVMVTDNPWVDCEIIGNIFETTL